MNDSSAVLDKWRLAVVHIEGVEATETPGNNDEPRYHGTAVLIEDGGRHYLLTAWHVLHDPAHAEQWRQLAGPDAVTIAPEIADVAYQRIFRVPTFDEFISGQTAPAGYDFLMNLSAGPPALRPFTFSVDSDLAVISLSERNPEFFHSLLQKGHVAITMGDVAPALPAVGTNVFSVGFPESSAVLGYQDLHPAWRHWASAAVSLPVFSWGRIAMAHNALPYLWADMTIYPGNSGGPLIADTGLVGIVTSQATVEDVRVPFARATPSAAIAELISEQRKKDDRHATPLGWRT